ncbi:MAG: hypothetical protein GX201_10645 [Clostridiales bacterium]|nr:hypothetical protein [Clostridiales bacterium]
MKSKLFRFIIYGLIGWCLEILWTGIGSLIHGNLLLYSFTYMWMFFIYGMGIFLEPIHNKIRNWNIYLRGGVWVLIIFLIEYSCGWALKRLLGHCPWDYGDGILSINGYIRLDFTVAWFFTGLLYEKVHDYLLILEDILNNKKYISNKD